MSRYAIVTEGITYKTVHAIEETDIRDVNQAIIEMKARQLSARLCYSSTGTPAAPRG